MVEAGCSVELFKAVDDVSVATRDKIAGLDMSADIDTLMKGAATVGDIDVMRVEYMDRYTKLCFLTCKLAQSGVVIPLSFELHVRMAAELQSMTEFLKITVRDKWSSMEQAPHFKAKLEDGRNLVSWSTAALSAANDIYTGILNTKARELEEICPPEEKVNDPEMLTNKSFQTLLFSNPSRDKLNPRVQELQDLLHLIKKGQSIGYQVAKDLKSAFKKAVDVRSRAKTAIMVDWTLDNILHDVKQSPGELKTQAETIREMVSRTSVQLPSYLDRLLSTMSGEALPA